MTVSPYVTELRVVPNITGIEKQYCNITQKYRQFLSIRHDYWQYVIIDILAHIFVDDAMDYNDNDEWMPNMFARQLVDSIDWAAR